jgi:hypothetical protein
LGQWHILKIKCTWKIAQFEYNYILEYCFCTSAAKLLFFQHIKYCNHGLFNYKVANEYSSFINFFQQSIHASPFSFLLSLYVFFTLVDFSFNTVQEMRKINGDFALPKWINKRPRNIFGLTGWNLPEDSIDALFLFLVAPTFQIQWLETITDINFVICSCIKIFWNAG